jgi:hypothetical protein
VILKGIYVYVLCVCVFVFVIFGTHLLLLLLLLLSFSTTTSYTRSPKPKEGSKTSPIPEDFEEEIIDELRKIVILKAAIVYCGSSEELNEKVCDDVFKGESKSQFFFFLFLFLLPSSFFLLPSSFYRMLYVLCLMSYATSTSTLLSRSPLISLSLVQNKI